MNYLPGYFAFPPPTERIEARIPFSPAENLQKNATASHNAGTARDDDAIPQEKLKKQEQRAAEEEKRRQRLERERHEVYLSELAWVRSGGILRDAQGRRDKARTAQMQEEIRLQDEERRILERWSAYETRLKSLYASRDPISWKDIPWPSVNPPQSDIDLTHEAVSEFIFLTFKVRGYSGSRKERIRSSLLRWHPDKMSIVLTRVVEEERDMVQEGINAVFRSLKQLQDEEKQGS